MFSLNKLILYFQNGLFGINLCVFEYIFFVEIFTLKNNLNTRHYTSTSIGIRLTQLSPSDKAILFCNENEAL